MLSRLVKGIYRRIIFIYHRYILFNLFILPYLRKKNFINEKFKIRYSFGGLILQGKKNTIKIGIGKLQTINKEHKLRLSAIKKWPNLDKILVSHDYIEHKKFPILIMPTYSNISDYEIKKSALALFNFLKQLSETNTNNLNLIKTENISLGLNIIKKMYNLENYLLLEKIAKQYMQHAINSYGFCHGDFHERNIMIDSSGSLRLIDLDSIRLLGIRDFDALHFVLEHFCLKNSVNWYEAVPNLIRNESLDEYQNYLDYFSINGTKELYIAYFLDRIGYEKKYCDIDCPKNSIDALIKNTKNKLTL
jgi:hypothetical protein